MTHKHMKEYSISLAIKKTQTKNTMNYNLIPTRLIKVKVFQFKFSNSMH